MKRLVPRLDVLERMPRGQGSWGHAMLMLALPGGAVRVEGLSSRQSRALLPRFGPWRANGSERFAASVRVERVAETAFEEVDHAFAGGHTRGRRRARSRGQKSALAFVLEFVVEAFGFDANDIFEIAGFDLINQDGSTAVDGGLPIGKQLAAFKVISWALAPAAPKSIAAAPSAPSKA